MSKQVSDKDLDNIYDYVNDMMCKNEWHDLGRMFLMLIGAVNAMQLDIMLAYATASLSGGRRIRHRRRFINLCKRRFPGKELWKGL